MAYYCIKKTNNGEAFIIKNLPPQSAISEAVSLASNFGTENSPRFVNGVLAKILRESISDNNNN